MATILTSESGRGDAALWFVMLFFSLTTDVNIDSRDPRVPAAHPMASTTKGVPGCVSTIFYIWLRLYVNFLSSLDNG